MWVVFDWRDEDDCHTYGHKRMHLDQVPRVGESVWLRYELEQGMWVTCGAKVDLVEWRLDAEEPEARVLLSM